MSNVVCCLVRNTNIYKFRRVYFSLGTTFRLETLQFTDFKKFFKLSWRILLIMHFDMTHSVDIAASYTQLPTGRFDRWHLQRSLA